MAHGPREYSFRESSSINSTISRRRSDTIQHVVSRERLVSPRLLVNVILEGCRLVLVRIEANHFQRFRQLLLYVSAESLSLHDVRF